MAITDLSFSEHLSIHAKGQELGVIHVSDLFLACGVCQCDRAAITYFEDEFISQIPNYILRLRVSREVSDEVQQKLREQLIMGSDGKPPKLAEYSGKGILGGLLRV